jgi:hypothetical protein
MIVIIYASLIVVPCLSNNMFVIFFQIFYQVGEGQEAQQKPNFAEEVAKMSGSKN